MIVSVVSLDDAGGTRRGTKGPIFWNLPSLANPGPSLLLPSRARRSLSTPALTAQPSSSPVLSYC